MLSAVFRTVVVYITVVGALRLMGKRQLGELQPSELVTTLLVSNVASICIDEPDLPLLASLGLIFLLTILEIFSSTLASPEPCLCQNSVWKAGHCYSQWQNYSIRAYSAANHSRRSDGSFTRQRCFFAGGCFVGRSRTKRPYQYGFETGAGRSPAHAAHPGR